LLLYNNVGEYDIARRATDDNIIRCMCCACWITNATDTHLEYVILTTFSRQQWLHECASMLRLYIHCLSCFIYKTPWNIFREGDCSQALVLKAVSLWLLLWLLLFCVQNLFVPWHRSNSVIIWMVWYALCHMMVKVH
jgi:hypothetical protein